LGLFPLSKNSLGLAKVIRDHCGPVLHSEVIRVKRCAGSTEEKDHNHQACEEQFVFHHFLLSIGFGFGCRNAARSSSVINDYAPPKYQNNSR
jgi:hypothetical protein